MKENKILTYEELLQERNIYENILNKETMEYIDLLLNLDISAINKFDSDVIRDVALSKLKFFRDVVAYNIFEKSAEIITPENDYYPVMDDNNLFICTKSNNLQSVLYNFDYNCEDDLPFIINLYGDRILSVEERIEALQQAIRDKNEEIDIGAEESDSYNSYIHSHEYFKLAYQLRLLKDKTKADLEHEYNCDLVLAQKRKNVLDTVLDLNNLDINSDFIEENGELVGFYPHTKIIVKKYMK